MSTNLEYGATERQIQRESRRQAGEAQREKKKQRRHYSSWNCSGGDKMRNASGHQSKENTYDISSRKRVTKKFLEVSLCIVVQNNSKEMYKKSVLQVQSCFFANQNYYYFSPFSGVASPLSITRFYILFEQTLNIIRASLLAP